MKENALKTRVNYNKIILAIMMLFVIMFFNQNNIFAEINEGYATETVSGSFIDGLAIISELVKPIGTFLLWVGGFIEWILSSVSLIITGQDTAVMPWADAIIFNAVPALDINFISPNPNSMISSLTSLIGKLYYTVLLLSISFTSIGVMLSAIKLAISAIAEEKAKYKKMIYNSFMCLLLLFTIHYLISFVFFLNESLVKMASTIVTTNIQGAKIFTNEELDEHYKLLLSDIETYVKDESEKQKILSRVKGNSEFYKTLITESGDDLKGNVFKYEFDFLGIDIAVNKTDAIRRMYYFYDLVTKPSKEESDKLQAMPNDTEASKYILELSKKYIDQDTILAKEILISETYYMAPEAFDLAKFLPGASMASGLIDMYKTMNSRLKVFIPKYNSLQREEFAGGVSLSYPIANLAVYLRTNSLQSKDGSFVRDEINLPFCIMYLMFVVQSLLYFFAYAKRLFFVMMFAIMAPAIVVWDYVNKN